MYRSLSLCLPVPFALGAGVPAGDLAQHPAKLLVLLPLAFGGGLQALQTALTDGTVTGQEWITITLAALGALGVMAVPNARAKRRSRS